MIEKVMPFDREIMLRTIYGTARNEVLEARIGVGLLILNRFANGSFAATVGAICLYKDDFYCWDLGGDARRIIFELVEGSPDWCKARNDCDRVFAMWPKEDITNGALYCGPADKTCGENEGVVLTATLGAMAFYKDAPN